MNTGSRKPRPLEPVPKTQVEILRIARERDANLVPTLTSRDLEVLFFALNRMKYSLEEQDDFIRFYMVVHEALLECRQAAKGN